MKEFQTTLLPKKYKILLIGDNCIDIYRYGTVERISPEAPVPVFKFSHQETKPGMAGNVLKNLENLDCSVDFYYDKESSKTRLIDLKSKQHIVRIDDDIISHGIDINLNILKNYNAVVISDYNKGTITDELIKKISSIAEIPIFIDTKKTNLSIVGNSWVKINQLEHEMLKCSCKNLIVTLGSQGTLYNNRVYPSPNVEVSDVCGAGDTFLASLVFKYLETNSIEESIQFANKAAAITVQHIGVYAPTLGEII
jgi:bifunctional ADP-heptose synthase (sugar kinase/adenylyltransferase)